MKFVANKSLVQGSYEFKNIEEARHSELAAKLFHFPFTKEVFISYNFIALAKYNITEWDEITQEVRNFILEYLQAGKPVVNEEAIKLEAENATQTEETTEDKPLFVLPKAEELGEVETRIVDIIEEYIKPAVEQDGGNIAFMAYEDGVVKVLLQGACSGCPSSTATLKNGILQLLQKMLPTLVKDVVAING
jgi:Fe-S cluster biogenesis protein NfuA